MRNPPSPYIQRTLESVLRRAVREFPAVILVGPRQSGKTTLLQHLFSRTHRYISLETPDIRAAAQSDPRGFLETFSPPVIYDEIQFAPELLMYIKEAIDQRRERCGQFLLTGSQNLLLMEQVAETLAGRVAVLKLLPLSYGEISKRPKLRFPWEAGSPYKKTPPLSSSKLWKNFLRGGFPELIAKPSRDHTLWYSSFIQTYLERDVRNLRQIGDLMQFQNFLRLLAARSGQLLQISDLSRDLGVAVNTVKAWLSILETTYQVIVLRPYFINIGKRLVKTPKVYLSDVGILCHLTGLRDAEHAANGPLGGAILETFICSELIKRMLHHGEEPRCWFWRTSTGSEVDFLVEYANQLIPIEVKLSATPKPEMSQGIKNLRKDLGDRVGPGYVIHLGKIRIPLGENTTALPLGEF